VEEMMDVVENAFDIAMDDDDNDYDDDDDRLL